ncbi:hypothetical protein ACJ70E_20760 [Pseudomonas plecoglossicida]|uniref:hypothetical protein n=1 Tax=Pseudomonas plecoglossicida TaxID=70775 RepID=UPI0039777BE5
MGDTIELAFILYCLNSLTSRWIMKISKTICTATASALNVIATALLFSASEAALENPGDPYDTSGIPALSMYIVLLITFTAFSVFFMLGGTIANKLLTGKLPKAIRLFLEFIPNFSTATLGVFVSFAYTDNTISMHMTILIYFLSAGFSLVAATLLHKKSRKRT